LTRIAFFVSTASLSEGTVPGRRAQPFQSNSTSLKKTRIARGGRRGAGGRSRRRASFIISSEEEKGGGDGIQRGEEKQDGLILDSRAISSRLQEKGARARLQEIAALYEFQWGGLWPALNPHLGERGKGRDDAQMKKREKTSPITTPIFREGVSVSPLKKGSRALYIPIAYLPRREKSRHLAGAGRKKRQVALLGHVIRPRSLEGKKGLEFDSKRADRFGGEGQIQHV